MSAELCWARSWLQGPLGLGPPTGRRPPGCEPRFSPGPAGVQRCPYPPTLPPSPPRPPGVPASGMAQTPQSRKGQRQATFRAPYRAGKLRCWGAGGSLLCPGSCQSALSISRRSSAGLGGRASCLALASRALCAWAVLFVAHGTATTPMAVLPQRGPRPRRSPPLSSQLGF